MSMESVGPETTANPVETEQPSSAESFGNVLAVFVVHFDVHKGNIIEWQYPQNLNLEGVEYQAICSGLHRIESDIIYFSRQNLYGVSVFQNIATETERGAYMKAVGLIVQPTETTGLCGEVWSHQDFLQRELSHHMVITEEVEPDRYKALLDYYNLHQYKEQRKDIRTVDHLAIPEPNSHSVNYNLRHNVTKDIFRGEEFGENSFLSFVNRFGPDIFILWKASLLRKRIMLVNMPPMEEACKYVYNIHLLGKVPARFLNGKDDIIPKFTVGVNDIPELERRNQSYVACTPDSIFQIKSDLYDLLVTLPTPSFHHHSIITGTNKSSPRSKQRQQQQQSIALSNLSDNQPQFKLSTVTTKHNTADFTRFRIMWRQLLSSTSTSWAEFVASEPNDLFGTTTALVTGIYYWLYEETPETSSRVTSSWQNMFAGVSNSNNHRRQSNSSSINPLLLNEQHNRFSSENQHLLSDDDEQDAMEINNNQVFEVVAARVSSELNASANEDVAVKEDNEFLLSFFHTLTYYLLSTLETIISLNEEDGCNIINLYPKDIVQLGLDPQADVDFIKQVAALYFKKTIQVNGIHNPQACISLCCPAVVRRQNNNHVDGAIRI